MYESLFVKPIWLDFARFSLGVFCGSDLMFSNLVLIFSAII